MTEPLFQMIGEGLEPSTHGLTCLTIFRWPRKLDRVDGLDYIITVSGVPRLVSEADSPEASGTSPADYPIPQLFKPSRSLLPTLAVASGALRASQQFAACIHSGLIIPGRSSHHRFSPNPKVRCSTD